MLYCIEEWLKTIEGSYLPGKFKIWCYQFGMLPRLQEMPMSTVEAIRKVSKSSRMWLGAPPGLSNTTLYRKSTNMSLPVSAVTGENKLAKVRALLTYRETRDSKVKFAGVEVGTGKKGERIQHYKRQKAGEDTSRL